jgi:hypothetical protein
VCVCVGGVHGELVSEMQWRPRDALLSLLQCVRVCARVCSCVRVLVMVLVC